MSFLLNRLLSIVLTLLLISAITFAITNILPGDVALMIMGTQSNPEALANMREALGLNDPIFVQYGHWIWGMVTGDWGTSLIFKVPIVTLLSQKAAASAMLVVLSMLIALIVAVPLGVWAAVHRNKWQDTASSTGALLGVSLPDFYWGIMLILLFARVLGWFPSSGFADPFENFGNALRYAFLPSLALGLGLMAHLTRMTRATMVGILGQEFIRVARAKGLSERTVVWRYGLANAIGPVMTIAGLQIGYLFGSIIVIETLFNYTGMGWLTYQALLNRDVPLIQATVFLIAAVVMLTNLVVDLLYTLVDPRIRLGVSTMKRFLNPKGIIGLVLIVFILAIAIFSPVIFPEGAGTKMNMVARLKGPALAHWFGTDQLGRDLMVRVMLGARTSLTIAGLAVGLSILIGLPLGIISGYYRGHIDNILMRLVDTLLSFPALLLALTISAMLGPNLQNTIISIGIAFTPFLARIVRGEALRVVQMPYVEAARSAGTNDLQMILRHILPNIMPQIIVQATISLAFAILAEAGLSFLGLGTQPPQSSWGLMIQASRDYLDVAPWTALVPGAAVALTVLGLNMFGDVLRDVLDPRVRG